MSLKSVWAPNIAGLTIVALIMVGFIPSTHLPARAQDSTPQKIESDDPAVSQAGIWLSQPAPSASGESYLYNTGEAALELQFSGPSVEILYVAGPSLGTLAIEVDGNVLRTVITTDSEVRYRQSAKIDYLTDENHTLRVYAQAGGVIGVDEFVSLPSESKDTQVTTTGDNVRVTPSCNTPAFIRRLTEGYDGTGANGHSAVADITADGRYVIFISKATNLLPNTPPLVGLNNDVYRFDRQTCELVLGPSAFFMTMTMPLMEPWLWDPPAISEDGRYIAFTSWVPLVPTDPSPALDAYLYDMTTQTYILVSRNAAGEAANAEARFTDISGDGRYVVFFSSATNLDPTDTTTDVDAFIFDRVTNQVEVVSVQTGGAPADASVKGIAVSDDGRYVAYESWDSTLVPNDTDGESDIFLTDRQAQTTTLVSFIVAGYTQPIHDRDPKTSVRISADGRFVAYLSEQRGIVMEEVSYNSVFVYDRTTGQNSLVVKSIGLGLDSYNMSANGRYFTFRAVDQALVEDVDDEDDVYLFDRTTGVTVRVSRSASGGPLVGETRAPRMSDVSNDGRFVAFGASASNIIEPDTNNYPDIFLADFRGHWPHSQLVAAFPAIGLIKLTWAQLAPTPTQFEVQRSTDLTNWTSLGTTVLGQTTFSDTSAVYGLYYYYRVHALTPDPEFTEYSVVTAIEVGVNLGASVFGVDRIVLNWTQPAPPPYQYEVQRATYYNGVATEWTPIATLTNGETTFRDLTATCTENYYYRLQVQTTTAIILGNSSLGWSLSFPCAEDAIALFRPEYNWVTLMDSLQYAPPQSDYNSYGADPPDVGQYIMGDWDGDGDDTPGVYANSGAFWYTNEIGSNTDWTSIWLGLFGKPVVAGRFDVNRANDCFAVIDRSPETTPVYALGYAIYYICDLTHGPTPPVGMKWLGNPFNNSVTFFDGITQFVGGQFGGSSWPDTVAVRRGPWAVWTVTPFTASNVATVWQPQSWLGAPSNYDYGILVAGNFSRGYDTTYELGLLYQNGWLYYRTNNNVYSEGSLGYLRQLIGLPMGAPFTAVTWNPPN